MTDRTVVYRLQVQANQAKAEMAAFAASVKKAANDTTAATKEGAKFRQGLDTLGGAAGKVGLVAAAGLGAAIIKAADFDQAMSNVSAATMESVGGMEALRKAALDAGASTVFSATEAAAGIEQLAKAGVETADILGGGLTGALDLAAAGTLDVGTASEIAATTMNQFGLEGAEVSHIADVLAASAGKAMGEVTDMAAAMKYVGPVAAQMGISLEEAAGSVAYLASQGVLGEQAGTSLRGMLTALTSPSKIAAQEMQNLGINMYDAQGQFIGLDGLAGQLQATMTNLTAAERDQAFGRIFGNEQITTARILYKGGAEAIDEWTAKVDDQGYAADQAAKKLDNLKGDLEALGGAFETALIGTGEGTQGPLRGLTQNLTDTVNAYNKLGEGAKSGVAVTLAATAAIGGGLFVFSRMVQSIAATRLAMQQLGISANVTKGQMAGLAKGATGVLSAATAVTILGNALAEANGAVLDSSDLQRNLEALSLGNGDATLDRLIDDLAIVNQLSGDLTEPLKETVTLFGLFGNTNLDNAKDNLAQMDNALAGLVESGNGDKAAEVFERIMEASDLDDAEVTEYFDSYQTALENTDAAARGAATAIRYVVGASGDLVPVTTGLTAATTDYQYAVGDAAEEVESFKDKLDRLNAVLDGRASLRDYEAALDDFTTGLKENGRTFDINTEKGRANQANLDEIAGSVLAVAGTMRGAARQKFLTTAIDDIRTMAQNMGLPKSEIKALIALLVEANKKDVKPKVEVDTAPALASFRAIDQWMTDLDGTRATTYVDTVRTVTGPRGGATFSVDPPPLHPAAGGHITGPGTATSDSIPAMLSNGEYVIRAAAVDHYGMDTFDRLNAKRFADGGSTKGKKKNPLGDPELQDSAADMSGLIAALNAQTSAAITQLNAANRAVNAAEISALAAKDQDDAADKALAAAQTLYDSVQAQTASLFEVDPLAKPDSMWAKGSDPFSSLADIIARTDAYSTGSTALAGRGLDGAALAYGLSNEDYLAQLTAMSDQDLQKFEDMFNQANAGIASASANAAQLTYGAQVSAAAASAAGTEAAMQAANARLDASNGILAGLQGEVAAMRNQMGEFAQMVGEAAADGVVYGGNKLARRGNG